MAHPQGFKGSELPNLTRQFGELVVVELAQKSVLTRRGEAAAHRKRLERSEATDLWRNRVQVVDAQLHSNASATSESATATHVQVRQLRHDQHARRDIGEGVVVELMEQASTQRHKNKKRRTLSLLTRDSCTMFSDTATSCREPSCGEQATREATMKRKKKNAQATRSRRAALAPARHCHLLSSHQEQFRHSTCRGAARVQEKSKFTIDRFVLARVASRTK